MSTPSSSPKAVKRKLADNVSKNVLRARRSVSQLIGLNPARDDSKRSLSASRCTPEPPQGLIPAEVWPNNKMHNDGQAEIGGWGSSASPSPLSLNKHAEYPLKSSPAAAQTKPTPKRHDRALTSALASSMLTRGSSCRLTNSPVLNENSTALHRSPSTSMLAPTLQVDIPSTSLCAMIASEADEWNMSEAEGEPFPVGSVPVTPSPLSRGVEALKGTVGESPQVHQNLHARSDSVAESSCLESKDSSPHQYPPTPMPGTTLAMDDIRNITPVANKSINPTHFRSSPTPMTNTRPPESDTARNQVIFHDLPLRTAGFCQVLDVHCNSNTPKSTPSFRPESELRSEVSISQFFDFYPDDPFEGSKARIPGNYCAKNLVSTPPSSFTSSPTLGQSLPLLPSLPSEDASASASHSPSYSKSSSIVEVDGQPSQTNYLEEDEQQTVKEFVGVDSTVGDGN